MKRRGRLTLAFAAAALSLGAASAAGIDNLLWDGAHTRAVMETISDPLSILDSRSPGARRADALRQTKPGHARSLAAVAPLPGAPEERVLASLRDRPLEPDLARGPALLGPNDLSGPDRAPGGLPFAPAGALPGAGPTPAGFTPNDFGGLPPPSGLLLPPNQPPPGGGVSPPGGSPPGGSPPGGSPPGGGPPGGSPPGGSPPVATPPGGGPPVVIPPGGGPPGGGPSPPGGGPPGGGGPVPEPASWIMMIMAMFAVGAALRRRRRKLADA